MPLPCRGRSPRPESALKSQRRLRREQSPDRIRLSVSRAFRSRRTTGPGSPRLRGGSRVGRSVPEDAHGIMPGSASDRAMTSPMHRRSAWRPQHASGDAAKCALRDQRGFQRAELLGRARERYLHRSDAVRSFRYRLACVECLERNAVAGGRSGDQCEPGFAGRRPRIEFR